MTEVSVVIPCFNPKREKLEKTIVSALNQTFKELQVIVVDDGSDCPFSGLDGDLLDRRITWICHVRNMGVSCARNTGVAASEGRLIGFLDSGDWWEREKVKAHVEDMRRHRSGWSFSGAFSHYPDGTVVIVKGEGAAPEHTEEILRNNYIVGSASSVFVDTELLRSVGAFDACNDVIEDWDLWIRLSSVSPPLAIETPLTNIEALDVESRSKAPAEKIHRYVATWNKHASAIRAAGLYRIWGVRKGVLEGHIRALQGQYGKAVCCFVSVGRFGLSRVPFIRLGLTLVAPLFPGGYGRLLVLGLMGRRWIRNLMKA